MNRTGRKKTQRQHKSGGKTSADGRRLAHLMNANAAVADEKAKIAYFGVDWSTTDRIATADGPRRGFQGSGQDGSEEGETMVGDGETRDVTRVTSRVMAVPVAVRSQIIRAQPETGWDTSSEGQKMVVYEEGCITKPVCQIKWINRAQEYKSCLAEVMRLDLKSTNHLQT
ncbi:hypothetical protein B0H19DRAFT_1059772 [Mycena capillaripes]|nr:hypothetical protein B0H19DRAFT_1059772 [Mycena capillaripes]